jgi:soluble lytic murein transglycosylase-like protein
VTVQPGESLDVIARRYGTTASALARLNGIANPNLVAAGRSLAVPGASTPASPILPGASRAEVAVLLDASAARHGVPSSLARAIAWQESGWSQSARSNVGAIGVMQLMPATAGWLGPAILGRQIDPHSVSDNVDGGVAFLAWLRRHAGNDRLAVAAYYQGLHSVRTNGLYGETEDYVASVFALVGRV